MKTVISLPNNPPASNSIGSVHQPKQYGFSRLLHLLFPPLFLPCRVLPLPSPGHSSLFPPPPATGLGLLRLDSGEACQGPHWVLRFALRGPPDPGGRHLPGDQGRVQEAREGPAPRRGAGLQRLLGPRVHEGPRGVRHPVGSSEAGRLRPGALHQAAGHVPAVHGLDVGCCLGGRFREVGVPGLLEAEVGNRSMLVEEETPVSSF